MTLGSRLPRPPHKATVIRPVHPKPTSAAGRAELSEPEREAARQAWRSFARAAGTRGDIIGRPRSSGGKLWLLALALGAGGLVWLTQTEEPQRRERVSLEVASNEPKTVIEREDLRSPGPTPATDVPSILPPRADDRAEAEVPEPTPAPESAAAVPARSASPMREAPTPKFRPVVDHVFDEPAPTPRRAGLDDPRVPPEGTPSANAAALAQIPVARSDGPPLAGVGAGGIHVDQIAAGSAYDTDGCKGRSTGFSFGREQDPSVCLRVVHLRQPDRLMVHWYKGSRLKRRTFLNIPGSHAYRTRATLNLKEGYVGRWTAKVLSTDGVELASIEFDVVD